MGGPVRGSSHRFKSDIRVYVKSKFVETCVWNKLLGRSSIYFVPSCVYVGNVRCSFVFFQYCPTFVCTWESKVSVRNVRGSYLSLLSMSLRSNFKFIFTNTDTINEDYLNLASCADVPEGLPRWVSRLCDSLLTIWCYVKDRQK